MPLFVPHVVELARMCNSGDMGITNTMLTPEQPKDPNIAGLANVEQTIFKGITMPIEPQIVIVSLVGGLIEAGRKLPEILDPTEAIEFLNEYIIKPVTTGLEFIGKYVPPSIDSLAALIVVPISSRLKTPNFIPFNFSLAGLSIPFPNFGYLGKYLPTITNFNGITAPPIIHTILGAMMVPINIMIEFFTGVLDFLAKIVNPAKITEAIEYILSLPQKLLPTIAMIQAAIAIPVTARLAVLIMKIVEAMVKMFKLLFGMYDIGQGGTIIYW